MKALFHAEIEATNLCNTRCLHFPHEVMSRPRGRMSWATFVIFVEKIREHLAGEKFSLSFSGMGEPLLHPELPRFIAHVSAVARTAFACNGAWLTEQNVRQLMRAGLDSLYVSFNGDEAQLFDQMMGGLPFDRVLSNLRHAVKLARDSRLEIRANVTVTKQTAPRLTRIRQLLHDEGVRTITFSLSHNRAETSVLPPSATRRRRRPIWLSEAAPQTGRPRCRSAATGWGGSGGRAARVDSGH